MSRTPLAERRLPNYTRGEEIFNMVSHIVGGAFGIGVLFTCTIGAAYYRNIWGIISGGIYGMTMVLLYSMSSVYHGLETRFDIAKKIFQIIDHCTIYFLISGTYTPILLTGIRATNPTLAWIIFGLVWGVSGIGIVLNAIDLRKFRVFSMISYLGIGWCIVFAIKPLLECYPFEFFAWIIGGGVAYTVGTIFYGIGSKVHYIHSVFHIFVLLGSIIQFVGILKFCILI